MSDKAPGSGMPICRLLVFMFCCAWPVRGLKPLETAVKSQAKVLEDTVAKELMKAVDKHFEKLTSRIATLENTLSSMQFYSIRQFNQISGSLQSTNNDLGTVRKQVSQMEIDGRSQKIGLSLLGREISELKKGTSDMLSELESSMIYVHENIDKQDSLIKAVLEETVIQTARETTAQISKQMEEMLLNAEAMQAKLVNCSVDFSSVIEHVDLRFLELKKQSHAQLLKQINSVKLDLKKNMCPYGDERSPHKERLTCDCKNVSGKIIETSLYNNLTKHTDKVGRTEDITTPSKRLITPDTSRHVSSSTEINVPYKTTQMFSEMEDLTTEKATHEKGFTTTLPKVTSTFTSTPEYESTQNNRLDKLFTERNKLQELSTQSNRLKKLSSEYNRLNELSTQYSRLDELPSQYNRLDELSTQRSFFEDTAVTTSRGDVSTQASSPDYPAHIPQDGSRTAQAEDDEKIMQALYNMTTSVLQAVSYFRNTGRMMEQILSNTDMLVVKQHQRLDDGSVKGPVSSNYGDYDSANVIPGSDHVEGHQRYDSQSSAAESSLSRNILENVATLVANSSQLLEVITDLAQMSSVSLIKVTSVLEDEVKRLEGLRTHMATTVLNRVSESQAEPVHTLTNATQRTFKLVEAVASNTGWIPLIFHSVQHLESLANRSLNVATQSQKIISQVQQTMTNGDSSKKAGLIKDDPIISNRIPRTLGQVESPPNKNTSLKSEDILNKAYFETIHSTSLQLKRIMPALTKLLSERGPLVTLVGGSRQEEGRVEIYHNGLWGSLCHVNLTHSEADSICRHLGFEGGISAGPGHFGPGSGVTWVFNASCLGADSCSLVTYTEESGHCNHDLDAAVLCDHMLRIVSSNGSTDTNEGRLEIYHKNAWLPVCADGWTDSSARVACQQMGFSSGYWLSLTKSVSNENSTFLGKTVCGGLETRLDICPSDGWTDSCSGHKAAGVSCL
ncbi:unnamed protein product [Candidula unifasciata]|uniref:SRCR domain-containing protein n=1 Tax=Candidula unifasciata TaxID=100452 RepID=A0A8S4A2K2_9EUPU|nr:unnamed protein product [Candidula unifasciata]